MRLLRSFSSIGTLVGVALARSIHAVFLFIDSVLDLLRPEPFRFAGDAHMLDRRTDGRSLDGSLLTSLRHEAWGGVRRGAPRNT